MCHASFTWLSWRREKGHERQNDKTVEGESKFDRNTREFPNCLHG